MNFPLPWKKNKEIKGPHNTTYLEFAAITTKSMVFLNKSSIKDSL